MWNDLKTRVLLLVAPVRDEEGQGMVEYALILALMSVIAAATLTPLGDRVALLFTEITTKL
jgi:pilus assembly protein Flp/PilA